MRNLNITARARQLTAPEPETVTITPSGRLAIIRQVGRMLPEASRENGTTAIEAAAPLLEWVGQGNGADDARLRFDAVALACHRLADAKLAWPRPDPPVALSPERLLAEAVTYYTAASGPPSFAGAAEPVPAATPPAPRNRDDQAVPPLAYLLPIAAGIAAVLLLTSRPFAHVGAEGKWLAAACAVIAVLYAGAAISALFFAADLLLCAAGRLTTAAGARLARSHGPAKDTAAGSEESPA